jgi:hypothetical protein
VAKNRLLQTVRDMVLSLGLVLGVVGLTLLMTLRDEPDDPIREIDPLPALVSAQTNSPFEVAVPQGLPDRWRPTSARVSNPGDLPFRWHVGYVTPDVEYAAAGQSNGSLEDYLDEERAGGTTDGVVTAAGRDWTVYVRDDGRRESLVHVEDGVITLVTGTGGREDLVVLAGSLDTEPLDIPVATPAPVDAAAAPTASN